MKKKDLIQFIPLAILSLLAIYSIIQVGTTNYIFSAQQYVGITLLSVSILLFFANRRIYKYIFGFTLILGMFGLVGFSTTIVRMQIFWIPIQITLLPIIAIFSWIHRTEIQAIIHDLRGTTEAQLKTGQNAKVNAFRKRFNKLSDTEIEQKLNENLVAEAKEALQLIRSERNV